MVTVEKFAIFDYILEKNTISIKNITLNNKFFGQHRAAKISINIIQPIKNICKRNGLLLLS